MTITTKFSIGDYVYLKDNPSDVFQIDCIGINNKNEITYYSCCHGLNSKYIYGKEEELVKLCSTC